MNKSCYTCHSEDLAAYAWNMDVFQTDWKEKHEQRGCNVQPTLLNVWQGYLGEENEGEVLEKINVPTIFHPDQGLFNAKRIPERGGGVELRKVQDSRKASVSESSLAMRHSGEGKGEVDGMTNAMSQGMSQGLANARRISSSVFSNVSKMMNKQSDDKDKPHFDEILEEHEDEIEDELLQNPDHETNCQYYSPHSVEVEKEDNFRNTMADSHQDHSVQLKNDVCPKSPRENTGSIITHNYNPKSNNNEKRKTHYGFTNGENLNVRKEYISDEGSSGIVSTTPSTPSRKSSVFRGFSRLTGFMKRPKRRRIRKASLEGTSGESTTSSLYLEKRPSPLSTSSIASSSKITNFCPMAERVVPNSHCLKPSKYLDYQKCPFKHNVNKTKSKRRSKLEIPTIDFVLSDHEPNSASPTIARTGKSQVPRKSRNKSVSDHIPKISVPETCAQSQFPSRNKVRTPTLSMLDTRGRCYRYPINQDSSLLFSDKEDSSCSDSVYSEERQTSLTTSGRQGSSSSPDLESVSSLPSLSNFSLIKLTSEGDFEYGSKSEDMFYRNSMLPHDGAEQGRTFSLSRRKSLSANDLYNISQHTTAKGVLNGHSNTKFQMMRSPKRLTPPPRQRKMGYIFCLPVPHCFAPFDRAMFS